MKKRSNWVARFNNILGRYNLKYEYVHEKTQTKIKDKLFAELKLYSYVCAISCVKSYLQERIPKIISEVRSKAPKLSFYNYINKMKSFIWYCLNQDFLLRASFV
jgi:hypothetical protein